MADLTRVFISHAAEDSSFAGRLAASLRDAGVSVWLDAARSGGSDLTAPNTPAIESCDALILTLSPAALAAPWPTAEMNTGIERYKQGLMRAPVVVVAEPAPLDAVPPLWTAYVWIDATGDEPAALALLLKALNVAPKPHDQPVPADNPIAAFLATPSQPLPWTPYPEVPARTAAPSAPLDLTRPSQPLLQQTATPSTPLPWSPYPGASHIATAVAEAPAYVGLATRPVWDQRAAGGGRSKVWIVGQAVGVLVPLGVFVALVFVRHRELVDGLRALAIASLAVAAVTAITLAAALGFKRARRIRVSWWAAIPLVALLAAGVAGGYAFPSRVHRAEAHFFEARQQWWPAIAQYELLGEQEGKLAPDIARVHDVWGEALLNQHDYVGAVQQFQQARESSQPGDANDTRAQQGLFQAYTGWMQADPTEFDYPGAIAFFESYRSSAACDSTCAASADSAEAQALFAYGSQLNQRGAYSDAVAQFETLRQRFPTSAFAAPAHTSAASAYDAWAKQLRAQSCPSSVPTYQTLASKYGDTPQGASAKAALAAPVKVTGNLINMPAGSAPTVYLSANAHAPMTWSPPPGSVYFSQDYATTADAGTGVYTFNSVAQGTYTISVYWGGTTEWWGNTSTNELQFFQVGPMCPYSIPTRDVSRL